MSTPKKPDFEVAFLAAHHTARRSTLVDERSPWVWPLPELNGRAPVVLDALHSAVLDPGVPAHRPRVLLAYARADFPSHAIGFLPFTRAGLWSHFLPSHTPVFAAQDGEIVVAEKLEDEYAVVVEHGHGWMTCYRNLERVFCRPREVASTSHKERVRAGDLLGYVGGSCLEVDVMKPLRFELWRRNADDQRDRFDVVDPCPRMETWLMLPHTDGRLPINHATNTSNAQRAA